MKSDVYMKVVLTVIAVCLVILVAQNFDFIPSARAAQASGDVMDVRVVGYSSYSSIPVEIKEISERDPIKVNITGSDFGFTLPVKVVER